MKYPGRGRLVPNEILDCTTSLFGGFKMALENLSEPQQKFLLHSAHDVYIPLYLKTSTSPAVLFALQAAKKG